MLNGNILRLGRRVAGSSPAIQTGVYGVTAARLNVAQEVRVRVSINTLYWRYRVRNLRLKLRYCTQRHEGEWR